MAVRNTNQIVAPSGNDGGIVLKNPSDIKTWNGANSLLPWAVDCTPTSGRDLLWLGDTATGFPRSRSGVSLPVAPCGSFCGFHRPVAAGTTTLTVDDFIVFGNTTAGNIILNLPAVAQAANQILFIKKSDNDSTNKITIDADGAELIDGELTLELNMNYSWTILFCSGVSWKTFKPFVNAKDIIFENDPACSIDGTETTILTSASIWFSGRPVIFFLDCTFYDNYTGNENFGAVFKIGFDSGSTDIIAERMVNENGDHVAASGSKILTPSRGNHTVRLRGYRWTGLGLLTMSSDDIVILKAIET